MYIFSFFFLLLFTVCTRMYSRRWIFSTNNNLQYKPRSYVCCEIETQKYVWKGKVAGVGPDILISCLIINIDELTPMHGTQLWGIIEVGLLRVSVEAFGLVSHISQGTGSWKGLIEWWSAANILPFLCTICVYQFPKKKRKKLKNYSLQSFRIKKGYWIHLNLH